MRPRVIAIAVWAAFSVLIASLFYTQIVRYPYYSKLSKNNFIRIIPIPGPRGIIFDRNGIPLVTNRISFDVAIVYQELADKEGFARLLGEVLGISGEKISGYLQKARSKPYAPVTIIEDVPKEKALILAEESFAVNGLVVETKSRRHYLYDSCGSHVYGYLGEISEEELKGLEDYGYRIKDLVGRSGLEKYYNAYLKGTNGGIQMQVDSKGRQRKVLGMKEPLNGKNLYLTIDAGLEETCDKLMGPHKGAIVVMDPRSGEVLALVSHPDFDPNIFVTAGTSRERLRLLSDKEGKPLLDRAISGLYSPGSVFKIAVACGALNARKITLNTAFTCGGSYSLGRAVFHCWKEKGHGPQDVIGGLMNSCNVFFYNTGRAAGVDNIESAAKLFGFGKPTGIDLPDEAAGLVPGRLWKRMWNGENWYEGETLNYAIGQGYLLATPIQITHMMAAMANKGSLVRPYLVRQVGDVPIAVSKKKPMGLKAEAIERVRRGLWEVVNNEGGTGKRAKAEGVAAAGKTGTAQNPQGPTHAWFSGFAPYDNAKICLVVFLEHGGKGGLEPAEIARGIFEDAKKRGYL